VIAAVGALAITSAPASATDTGQRVDVALEWWDVSATMLSSSDAPVGTENTRAWAITWFAPARAVNKTPTAGPAQYFHQAAFAAAAHECLVTFVPARRAELDQALATTLGRIPDGPAETQGVAAGRAEARAVLADRAGDGLDNTSANEPFTPPPPGPGVWQPTPPDFRPAAGAGLSKARPFALERADQLRPGPPPAPGSAQYRADWTEVRDYGSSDSTGRTAEQTQIATFFNTGSNVYHPAVKAALTEMSGDLERQAEFLAIYHMAVIDMIIAAWEAKYHYVWWRPITAIRNAEIDGDPTTAPDPDWTPLHTTPPHPDYLSGHAGFTGATVAALNAFTGAGPGTRFTLTSANLPGVTRSYTRWDQLVPEMIGARVWSGIHTRTADVRAVTVGRRVTAYMISQSDSLFG
jgi:hypothetical protein